MLLWLLIALSCPTSAPVAAALPVVVESEEMVKVIPRSAWGAKPPRAGLLPHMISHLTVHHSAVLAPDAVSAPARIRRYQALHQSRGFPDIAYHFIVDRAGNVYEGRSIDHAGSTFTHYDPAGHLLALLDGNFERQEPSTEQLESLVQLLAWASEQFGVDPEQVGGHRDHAATLCPGKAVLVLLRSGELGRRVKERTERVNVSLRILSETEGFARLPR